MDLIGKETSFDRIKEVLRAIPPGRVASYGQVAALAGYPKSSRLVVWVLKAYSEKDGLPWHRVVRKDGQIAIAHPDGRHLQKILLEAEGVSLDPDLRVPRDFFWKPEV